MWISRETLVAESIVIILTQVAIAETSQQTSFLREPYVMHDACRIAQLLNYTKIDGEWVGGRSVWRGQAPITGGISQILENFLLFTFEASTFRSYVRNFDTTARYWNVVVKLDPDLLGPKDIIRQVDYTVAQLLNGLPYDPWSTC